MSNLAVKGPRRPHHIRTKSSSRSTRFNDSQSDKDVKARRDNKKKTDASQDDDATAAFVRRTLCAGHLRPGVDTNNAQPLDQLLPPLTSSNDIDLQLYAIIAIILKEVVQVWYSRITPDHEFVDEIVQIIAHCTRGLEQRLRRVDLESLIMVELPEVLNVHAETFRFAKTKAFDLGTTASSSDSRAIYHALSPHPALSPVPTKTNTDAAEAQRANELVWRQLLIERVLHRLLPPEDLENPCLAVLVNEIFSELIIGNILSGKVCEGWFIWDGISKAIQVVRNDGPEIPNKPSAQGASQLQQFGLVSKARPPPNGRHHMSRQGRSIYSMIINAGADLIRLVLLLYSVIRLGVLALKDAVYLPPRTFPDHNGALSPSLLPSELNVLGQLDRPNTGQSSDTSIKRLAILDSPIWLVPATILGLNARMPWLTGLSYLIRRIATHGPGQVASSDTRLDRLLSHHITAALLDPTRIAPLLRTLRINLFPSNAFAQGKPPPSTPAEISAIKRRCAEDILSLVPDAVRRVYFGPPPGQKARAAFEAECVEREVLDLFGDGYLNKHWVFAVVEVVVCRLFPEIMVAEER